jgi:PAS domain S-box-containing protein
LNLLPVSPSLPVKKPYVFGRLEREQTQVDNSAQLKTLLARQNQELQSLRHQLKQANYSIQTYETTLAGLNKDVPQLQTLLNLSNDLLFVVNEAGLVRQVSSSLERRLGYAPREINGRKLNVLINPADQVLLEKILLNSLAQPGISLSPEEIRFKHRNGEWRYFEIVATNLVADRHMGGLVFCAGDITERKQLAEKLALTQKFLVDFDEELRPLTGEAAVWEKAIRRLETAFEGARIYFAEMGESADEDEQQLLIHPPSVHRALFSGYSKENSQALEILTGLLIEAAEGGQPVKRQAAPPPVQNEPFEPETGQPARSPARSMMLVPLFKDDRLVIALVMEAAEGAGAWSGDDPALLHTVLQRLWLSVQNVRLYRRGQEAAVLEERLRLARDLHDSIQQNLYGIELNISTALSVLKNVPVRPSLQLALDYSRTSQTELHSLLFDLRPESLQNEGLVAVLQRQLLTARRTGSIEVKSNLDDEPAVALETKEALYWIGREALHNAVKHSQATLLELNLEWTRQSDCIQLTISDNGRGFDSAGTFPGHIGLLSMQERAARLGGTISIQSAPQKGTVVRVTLPLK